MLISQKIIVKTRTSNVLNAMNILLKQISQISRLLNRTKYAEA